MAYGVHTRLKSEVRRDVIANRFTQNLSAEIAENTKRAAPAATYEHACR
jgi:hypothetical protein